MTKFIVYISKDISDESAANALTSVIVQGKISDNGKSYCYATRFAGGVMVTTAGTKPNGTTTFYVYKEN